MRRRDDSGQVSVLIIGFAAVLLLAIAVVIDASAAYLQRQGLDTLADGAALRGADLGATGEDVYRGGVTDDDLELTAAKAQAAVRDYLADVGAYQKYPGLTAHVTVTDDHCRGAAHRPGRPPAQHPRLTGPPHRRRDRGRGRQPGRVMSVSDVAGVHRPLRLRPAADSPSAPTRPTGRRPPARPTAAGRTHGTTRPAPAGRAW